MAMWELDEALPVVRQLANTARNHNYHLCLGGSVLHRGQSDKDLDLYFIPLVGSMFVHTNVLVAAIERVFGPSAPIDEEDYPAELFYEQKLKFVNNGRRVDVFIVRTTMQIIDAYEKELKERKCA